MICLCIRQFIKRRENYEDYDDVSIPSWHLIFEENKKLYLMEFMEETDGYSIETIADTHYGPINVSNKTIYLDKNAEYTFYLHNQSKINIFGYFNKIFPGISDDDVFEDLFLKKLDFIKTTETWDELFKKIKNSKYKPEDIINLLKL